jgi:hypothetical protein
MRTPWWIPWRRWGLGLKVGAGVLVALLLLVATMAACEAQAGPVSWQELPPAPEGRQWWDRGSLRLDRQGHLSVLSRYQPPAEEGADRPPLGRLYVMELDCDQQLYRDVAINGLPQFGADWQVSGADALTSSLLNEACAAGADLLSSASLSHG